MSMVSPTVDHAGMARYHPPQDVLDAGRLSVYQLFCQSARRQPDKIALSDRGRKYSYQQTLERVQRLAAALSESGVRYGDRIAVLLENRIEYIEIHLAAASLGAIVACQNWRLSDSELHHCVQLVAPGLLIYSQRYSEQASALQRQLDVPGMCIEDDYEDWLNKTTDSPIDNFEDLEAGLLILYTSGTTGPAKAAVISHRALIARMHLLAIDLNVSADDGFVAWSPMFHMGGSEHSLSTLMLGGTVFVADGFDVAYIVELIDSEKLGWLLLVPATIERLVEELDQSGTQALGVKCVGAMADLLPKQQIALVSRRLNAPFLNTFGATETGIAPASNGLIEPGIEPTSLSKKLNSFCALRLENENYSDAPIGVTGEALVKGPTLFSGYWDNEEVNKRDFAGGWFRMGDLFKRNPDGTVDFMGRAKYLIKSGGENIYPAEIEQILLSNEQVRDAIVVAFPDPKWGEVPVAVVAVENEADTELVPQLLQACKNGLAKYKCPRRIVFVDFDLLPRSSSGKIIRSDVEIWLQKQGGDS